MRIVFLFFWLLLSQFLFSQDNRYVFTQQKMGSPFHLVFYCGDSSRAIPLANASFHLVDSLNNIFSDYLPGSELNRVCATAGKDSFVTVSDPLYEIFLVAEEAWQKTKGSFDITIGPLSKVWRKARKEKFFPHPDSIQKATEKVGWSNLLIDKENHRIKLVQNNMQLDLGGIAAGYIAQKIADFLKTQSMVSALVDASGDIVCTNPPPGKQSWIIGINQPGEANKLLEKNIEIKNCSVSTSGDVFQFIEHKGKKYSHIINPKTGYGTTFQRNVTIIAPDGTTADWLATACSILPLKKVRKLTKKLKAEFLITQRKKSRIKQYNSPGFRNYWEKTN